MDHATVHASTSILADAGTSGDTGTGAELPSTAVWAAGLFAFSSTLISMVAIWMQLKNYRKPLLQRYVVRILWMVPIFAISSWISLVSLNLAFYVDALRDIYEAFVIYCFFSLLVSYLGGERALLIMLHGRPYTKHLFPIRLWYREMDVGDPYSFLFIKRGILQYVYVKPVLAAITMLLKSNGAYNDGSLSLKSGYFWIAFVYNLSVCLSLYCLGMFFMATQEDLEDFRIKVLFLVSFYQGVAISILVAIGVMRSTSPESAVAIQDFLICLEMIFVGLGHWYAFSHRDYVENDIQSARLPVYYAVRDACGIQDVIQDSLETLKGTRFTYRTFEPSEGVATVGMSRSGRIMAGLRYSAGGTSKYWLPEATDANEALLSPGVEPNQADYFRNQRRQQQQQQEQRQTRERQLHGSGAERPPSLYFADVGEEDEDGVEELYDSSKQMEFGDYNFPAIDVHDPTKARGQSTKSLRKDKKKRRDRRGLGERGEADAAAKGSPRRPKSRRFSPTPGASGETRPEHAVVNVDDGHAAYQQHPSAKDDQHEQDSRG
ncbi:hypothetical protein BGZ68_001173, partial [Mortierella alpina]